MEEGHKMGWVKVHSVFCEVDESNAVWLDTNKYDKTRHIDPVHS